MQGDQEQESLSASWKIHPTVFSKQVRELEDTSHAEQDNKKTEPAERIARQIVCFYFQCIWPRKEKKKKKVCETAQKKINLKSSS